MKKTTTFRSLTKELSRDPQLKQAMARARREPRGKDRAKVERVTGVLSLLLTIASRFSKKKKARTLDELKDAINLLVQASLLLKENILDRPEVKKFFQQRSKEIYLFAQECVDKVVPKKVNATLKSKSV
jgi:hypothetical protein